ncbi:isopeptide-forming domain-containing fimbrial protein [Calothrix sp. CCY 0018]|uniref:isopeptide-forming domain-containing fimbrial protein n=1 Tax=Calothrix sp. CCY 0018 TaxID=3103864 RepID=UPI0039C761E4
MKSLFNYLREISTARSAKGKIKHKSLASLALIFCTWGYMIVPAQAEGSRELVKNGGDRPYTEWSDRESAAIKRKTRLKVFVKSGETINLGSSVNNSPKNQDIILRTPSGTELTFDVKTSGEGFIDTVAKESAGPLPNINGYNPYKFTATETGIYEVEFRSQNANGGDPPPLNVSQPFITNQRMTVAAWDITVRDSSGNPKNGRVFTNYVAMNMGGSNRQLNSKFFIQTKDGFLYRTAMNGVDPYGFIFFGNSRGFIDLTNNSTLYSSAKADENTLDPFQGNVKVQRPDVPDTPTDITHLTFFNSPDPETLDELGIPRTPAIPATPTNFKFTGGTGGSGNQTFIGVGGNFSFDSTSAGSYEIIIDTDENGIFDPSKDRVLQNIATAGSNVVSWDGQDADGNNLGPRTNNNPYNTRIRLRTGEYHFPMLDAENNSNGFVIEMLNAPTAFPSGFDKFTVYYNDDNYTTSNGKNVDLSGSGATNPRNAATGTNSSTGAHKFSNNYGDFKGIDTWSYFPSQATFANLIITNNKSANVRGTKSVQFLEDKDSSGTVTVGDRVEYTITYTNNAPEATTDANNFIIEDTLPSQLTYNSSQIVSQTTGNDIQLNTSYNGSGALTNSSTLRIDDEIVIKITATINNDNNENPISNQANATFNTPDNPATTGTALTDADSAGVTQENPPSEGNAFKQIADDGQNTGNDPSNTADDEPTIITVEKVIVSSPPKVLLIKRITALNQTLYTNFVDGVDNGDPQSSNYVPTPKDTDDNNPNWISNFLLGEIAGVKVQPNDELEYTIYYLSAGDTPAKNVLFCDRVPQNVSFIPNSFNNQPNKATGGLQSADRGILWLKDGNTESLTNAQDGDFAQYFPPSIEPSTVYPNIKCDGTNTNGAVVVNLGNLPNATASGEPNTSYGFIKFRGRVK